MLTLMIVAVLAQAAPAEMSPERVAQAIAQGLQAKEVKLIRLSTGRAECFMSTPFLRIARAANEAKRGYATFTADDVTPEMLEPVARLACPSKSVGPNGDPKFGFATVERVVITGAKGSPPITQPTKSEPLPETYKNALGGSWDASGLLVTFPLEAFQVGREVHIIFDRKVNAMTSRCDDCRVELKPEHLPR